MSKDSKLLTITGIYIFCIILSETFGIKTLPLGDHISFSIGPIFIRELKVSVAIFLLPIIFSLNDIVIEVWGKETAKTLYRIGLGAIVGLIIFSFLATLLPPSQYFSVHEAAYDEIFNQTFRIAMASIIAFALSDLLDIMIFSRLRKKFMNLGLRTNVSNFLSQFIDTTVFTYLAFFAGDHSMIWGIILPYYVFKCCMSVITTPFVYLGVNYCKKG